MPRRYAGLGPPRIRTKDSFDCAILSSTRPIIPVMDDASQKITPSCPITTFFLSQSRCLSLLLAMSSHVYLFFPPRGHGLPPTLRDRLSPHLSLQNAVAFHSPAMPNARMSLCTQSVHSSFSFPPRPLCTAPLRFPNTIRFFGSRPPHSDEHPHPQKKSSRAQRCLNAVSCAVPRWCKVRPGPVVYGAEFGVVVFLAKGPRSTVFRTGGLRLPRRPFFTIRVLRESATSGLS